MSVSETGGILSVDQMLANAKKAAESKGSTEGMSRIQKMLQGREERDSVNLSPVARLMQARTEQASKKPDSYKEEEWYINAKVSQLRAQLQVYSTLPGLDPSGGIMESIEAEIKELAQRQMERIQKSQVEAKKKQDELARLEKERANQPLSAEEMLERTKKSLSGTKDSVALSDDVQKMLDRLKTDSTA